MRVSVAYAVPLHAARTRVPDAYGLEPVGHLYTFPLLWDPAVLDVSSRCCEGNKLAALTRSYFDGSRPALYTS